MKMKKESQNSKIEEKAIRILEDFLDGSKAIKTHFKREDKTQLFDGFFNLLDQNNNILKRFDVQIKGSTRIDKLKKGPNKGKVKFCFDVHVLDAVRQKVTENPTFYFVVDIKTQTIYYKHLTTDFLVGLNYLATESTSVVYYFCDSDKLVSEALFVDELQDIRKMSVERAVFKSAEEIKTIQEAMNGFYRKTHEIDFIMKSIWPNLWKFGLKTSSSVKKIIGNNAEYKLASDCTAFAIYPIMFGDTRNEVLDYSFSEENIFDSLDFTNEISPEDYLNDCLTNIISHYFSESLDYIRYLPTICLNEIVFSYLDSLAVYDESISSKDRFKTFVLDTVSLNDVAEMVEPYVFAAKGALSKNNINWDNHLISFFSNVRFPDGRFSIKQEQVKRSICVDLAVRELLERGEREACRPWKMMATKANANLALYKADLYDENLFRQAIDQFFLDLPTVLHDFEKAIPASIDLQPKGLYFYQIIRSENPFPYYSIKAALIDDKSPFRMEKKEVREIDLYKSSFWSATIETLFEDGTPYTHICRLILQKAICEKLGIEDKGITLNDRVFRL